MVKISRKKPIRKVAGRNVRKVVRQRGKSVVTRLDEPPVIPVRDHWLGVLAVAAGVLLVVGVVLASTQGSLRGERASSLGIFGTYLGDSLRSTLGMSAGSVEITGVECGVRCTIGFTIASNQELPLLLGDTIGVLFDQPMQAFDVFVVDSSGERTPVSALSRTLPAGGRMNLQLDLLPQAQGVDRAEITYLIRFAGAAAQGEVEYEYDTVVPDLTVSVAQKTRTPSVYLAISYSDESGIAGCRFKNEESEWTKWESCSESKLWSLSDGAGEKRVGVEVRDLLGNSVRRFVKIEYDPNRSPVFIKASVVRQEALVSITNQLRETQSCTLYWGDGKREKFTVTDVHPLTHRYERTDKYDLVLKCGIYTDTLQVSLFQ